MIWLGSARFGQKSSETAVFSHHIETFLQFSAESYMQKNECLTHDFKGFSGSCDGGIPPAKSHKNSKTAVAR